MTNPPEVPPGSEPAAPPLPPPVPPVPPDPPIAVEPPLIGTASSVGYGCAGFIGFFFVAAFIGGTFASSMPAGVVLLGATIVGIVAIVRSTSARGRAISVRLAIGVGIAAVLFGGCIALLSNTNFH